MKLIIVISTFAILFSFSGCVSDDEGNGVPQESIYREHMRSFVIDIALHARQTDPNFIVIPQNGHDLLTMSGNPDGEVASSYVAAISGAGQEDLFYGYDDDNLATPSDERTYLMGLLDVGENNGVEALVTDYCWTQSYMDNSYTQNELQGYISFAADDRDLRNIPDYPANPYNENADDIDALSDAKNFLYLLDPGDFVSKADFLTALQATNYDVIIMDFFFGDIDSLTVADVTSLKTKANGGSRLVISYMSIGEAEDYRYYWQESWNTSAPSWLKEENPEWLGNYKVEYWDPDWQAIIFGSASAYLDLITTAGFNGVYLDIIEAFEYFE
jgi:cysteinyl-tRNA synthetase, unknown class